MLEGQNNYTVSIPAGVSLKVSVPIDLEIGYGFFPTTETSVEFFGKTIQLISGFGVLDEDVGDLIKSTNVDGNPEVIYRHNKQAKNKIYFVSDNNIYQTLSIVNIPLHDHSSVDQGGPAFGTYYVDYKEEDINKGV
jgi:hypothetical protein